MTMSFDNARSQPGDTSQLISIQCLRGIAAFAVLLCHIGNIEGLYTQMRFLPEWGKHGVDLFFVISGFVMVYISHPKWGNRAAAKPFLFKRVMRIYPVYWEFTFVILAAMLLLPQVMNLVPQARPSVIKSLLLWPQNRDPLLGVGWTLVYEMYFYVLFCSAFLLPRKYVRAAFGCWVAALAAANLSGVRFESYGPEMVLVTSPLAFEFMMGCVLAWCFLRGVRVHAGLLLAAAVVWGIFTRLDIPMEDGAASRVLQWGIPSAFAVYAFLMIESSRPDMFPFWLRTLGDASFSLYLSHSLVLSALGKLWHRLPSEGLALHITFIAICLLTTISVALLNYRFFERPLSRWHHRKALKLEPLRPRASPASQHELAASKINRHGG